MGSNRGKALIQETRAIWQERYPDALSEVDAQDILTNTSDLFNLLAKWDQADLTAEEGSGGGHAAR